MRDDRIVGEQLGDIDHGGAGLRWPAHRVPHVAGDIVGVAVDDVDLLRFGPEDALIPPVAAAIQEPGKVACDPCVARLDRGEIDLGGAPRRCAPPEREVLQLTRPRLVHRPDARELEAHLAVERIRGRVETREHLAALAEQRVVRGRDQRTQAAAAELRGDTHRGVPAERDPPPAEPLSELAHAGTRDGFVVEKRGEHALARRPAGPPGEVGRGPAEGAAQHRPDRSHLVLVARRAHHRSHSGKLPGASGHCSR